ncbi:ABC-type multidrug transport system, ATPase and permease component [Halapricum desulfuricans]|uniref:ABC-type multidrug transport system, ATPase and permease component n=2 Tax=Halapricum desulfuricans TaxID=2841257 RepID=A0A897N794_9EURY|nr:ABC transporter ATP-binding protein [Halapricum desulfuricans]QSG06985.1 ABC-type multidrug transport system, ATPase and permease component [Halapricum desulfuricans]
MDALDPDDDDVFEAQRERVERPMVRLFREYGRENAGYFGVGLFASIVARVLDLLPPLFLGIAIDAIIRQETSFSLLFVPDAWIPTAPRDQLWIAAAIVAGAFLFGAAFHWARNWGWNNLAQHIQHDVRTDTYDQMQRLNMDFFADKQTGEMMSVLSNDVNRLERFLNDGMNAAFRLIVMVVGIAVILFSLNWQLALIALVPVPLIAFFTKRFIETIQPKYADVRSSVGALNSRLENNLGGIQVIKSSNTESYESDRVDDVSRDYFDANWDAIETRIKFFPGLRVISGIGFVLTFAVGGYWALTYETTGTAPWLFSEPLTTGQFVVFITLTQRFVWPMAQFGQIINMYQRAYASAERIFGLMDTPARIEEDPDADPLDVTDGRVVYEAVTFGYDYVPPKGPRDDPEGEPIVEDVSFEVEGGETVALVGPTGAGKSTILKLLLRMYDVDEGAITVDGTDLREVTIPSLRRQIGYVSQETFLFYGTVEENITYGTFDASREAVVEAAKMAEAHKFIENLPDGYETKVGERGVKLSGGQRQRIAIARAILKDPEILVLDEATSDVDTETEMLIQKSLDELAADRTTFAIAHRLSTIKDADQIVVVEDGRIVERGTHDDLLAADGLYANLWAVQAGEIDELPREFIERAARRRSRVDAEAGDD